MRLPGFIGPTYQLRTVNADCQRCVNLYPELNELKTATDGEIGALMPTPGLRLLGTCGSGPIRGVYTASTGGMVIVSGSEVYRVGYGWTFTRIGDLLTNTGRVSIADNGTQIMIVDGANGYIVSLVTAELTRITSDAFPGANTVAYQDGYFICNNPGTGQFFWSALNNGLSWDALDFITAEGSPDATLAVVSDRRQLWVLGQKTVEVFYNSGGDTTWNRIDGAFAQYGLGATHTALGYNNTVVWLGGGEKGAGIVWMANGFTPQRISNHSVELAIKSYGDVSNATAWTYQHQGHAFYVLNFPNAEVSWVYDIATGQWHERAYLGLDGNFERHRAECYAFGFSEHVVGDYANANIYALDHAYFSDNGRALVRLRRSAHLSANALRMFVSKFQLICRVGTGLDGSPSVGSDPQVELRYSDDYGNTWTAPRSKPLGWIGQYAKRVIWRQLGSSRNRVYEIRISDPVDVAILGAEVDVKVGAA